MSVERFDIRLGPRSLPLLRLWGVKPGLAYADVGEAPDDGEAPAGEAPAGEAPAGELQARFGRVRFATPLSNVASWRVEGPFIWVKAIGVRRSLRGGDVSFAGAAHGGVRIDFREPVRWSIFHVPALYVGADDLDAFAAALRLRGIPGEDARRNG
jgi:hypothetical protein